MDKPIGPRGKAMELEAIIADLELQRAAVARAERKPLNQRLHMLRGMLRWCKTRAGY